MSRAILTMDDIPQGVTRDIVDYLNANSIPVIMFAVGENVERDMDTVVYAIRHGIIVGNHSYTHPSFEDISYEEAVKEIERTDELIDQAYKTAGVSRDVKLFRFPYLNKGGDKKEVLQRYLRQHDYSAIMDDNVKCQGYIEAGWNEDVDVCCSFDCQEYLVPSGDKEFEDIMNRIDEGDIGMGSNVITDEGENIILLHSHDDTERVKESYYKVILNYMQDKGVCFIKPKFMKKDIRFM